MPKKVLDSRIAALVRNGVQTKHRSFFVIVGDRGKDQVVNLHWLLSQSKVSARPSVLWCYKKDLGFTSHRKKRENKIKKEVKRGIREPNSEDPFELFVAVTDIRYTYYKETHKILGNTYGMCILQDFEAITPNILARTVETVEGGGIVVLLLKTMKSLKQLYTMTMDVHLRYRTESSDDVIARFNERFILSLGNCENCLVVDDELNVLPISAGKDVKPLPTKEAEKEDEQLTNLKESLKDTQPAGALVSASKTLDQAKAILTFIEAISEKTLSSTVTLTASRGRGKSAALGIAIAAAIAHGYSNIFVTSPSPENLKTVFQFIFKGFDGLNYEEHLDYEIIQSTNPDFNKSIVRVNVFKSHRQTIQYIQPEDAHVLGQAELVVIDEAAAIPLPLVKNLIGPYLVFMASTINGYEGTGRSLSLKLIQQLREQSRGFVGKQSTKKETEEGVAVTRQGNASKKYIGDEFVGGHRKLREIKLEEPIRYGPKDPIETWLNKLLCLNATTTSISNTHGCPHPSQCELYYINRDTLFSYHPASEAFLQRMMALYVASHYKNSPNDLILLADAPQHVLFVLLAPVDPEKPNVLPEPLCVIQVALEGNISKQTVINNLSRGLRQGGDLIPWLISQQFQDDEFAGLSGARIVRIATHPDYIKMGYGSRALELLEAFYRGNFTNLDEKKQELEEEISIEEAKRIHEVELANSELHSEKISIRDSTKLPPLLLRLSEKKAPAHLDYMGVSYGLTPQLHKFWKRTGYVPVYLRQTSNELTGEHTCVMLKTLTDEGKTWLSAFARDFQRRFSKLLAYQFRKFQTITALMILEAAESVLESERKELTKRELDDKFTPFDLKRLESYANSMVDHHLILDLLPIISELYFSRRLGDDFRLSGVQSAILLAIGQQCKTIEDVEKELNLKSSQILALFLKVIKKVSTYFTSIQKKAIELELPSEDLNVKRKKVKSNGKHTEKNKEENSKDEDERLKDEDEWKPLKQSLEDDLQEAGDEVKLAMREKQRELINSLDLSKYAIAGNEEKWQQVQDQIGKKNGKTSTVISVPMDEDESLQAKSKGKRKSRDGSNAREIAEKEAERVKKLKKAKPSRKAR